MTIHNLGGLLAGVVLILLGGHLLLDQVTADYHPFQWVALRRLGFVVIVLAIGIGMVAYEGHVRLACVLGAGLLLVTAIGLGAYLDVEFRSSALDTGAQLGCLLVGLGLVGRSVWPRDT